MSNEVRFEVIMSAMYLDSFDIAFRTGIDSDLLIINQCDQNAYQEMDVNGHLWRMISTTERGLSKSRNMALENAKGEICLFCDDDETMARDYARIILGAFHDLPDATAIVFNVNRANNAMKKKYYRIASVRLAPKYRAYGSPMLAIKLNEIRKHQIWFNEKFGSGSSWGGGEDSLFEHDMRRCGLKIYEYPAEIATIDYSNESKWFHGYTEQYFYNLGAFHHYMYNNNVLLKFLWRAYTCYKLRKDKNLSFLKKLYWMYQGGKGMGKDVTYTEFLEKRSGNKGGE